MCVGTKSLEIRMKAESVIKSESSAALSASDRDHSILVSQEAWAVLNKLNRG